MNNSNEMTWLIITLTVAVGLPLLVLVINRLRKKRLKLSLKSGQREVIARWNYGYSEWSQFVNGWLNQKDAELIEDEADKNWRQINNYGNNVNSVMPTDTIISADGILFNYIFIELNDETQPKATYKLGNPSVLLIDYLEITKYCTYKRRMTIPVPQSFEESNIKEVVDKFNNHYLNSWWNR